MGALACEVRQNSKQFFTRGVRRRHCGAAGIVEQQQRTAVYLSTMQTSTDHDGRRHEAAACPPLALANRTNSPAEKKTRKLRDVDTPGRVPRNPAAHPPQLEDAASARAARLQGDSPGVAAALQLDDGRSRTFPIYAPSLCKVLTFRLLVPPYISWQAMR